MIRRSAAVILMLGACAFAQTIKKVPAQYTSPADGQQMYSAHCAACHGVDGTGNGPASPALKARPTDLTQLTKSNGGKFPDNHVYNAIKGEVGVPAHGSKDMPVWGNVFRSVSGGHDAEVQQRLVNLTQYVKKLQQD
jgi:mono/diheme cytochrome c family protein